MTSTPTHHGEPTSDGHPSQSILARLRDASLTPSEQRVAQLIVRDYPQAALLNGRDLAKLSKTSPATVTRLVAKIGYSSLDEMQRHLRRELSNRLSSPSQRMTMASTKVVRDAQALVERSMAIDINNIENLLRHLDMRVFERIVDSLSDLSRPVYVMGPKKAFTLALYFSIQMNQARPDVHLLRVDDVLTDQLLDLPPEPLLVAFVPRRLISAGVSAIREFKKRGGEVVLVSDLLPPEAVGPAHALITVPAQGATVFDSYTALITLINALVAGVVSRNHELVSSRLAQLEGLSGDFGVWDYSS